MRRSPSRRATSQTRRPPRGADHPGDARSANAISRGAPQTYRIGRIVDQRAWYERKAELNRTLARRAHLAIIGLELLAVIAALLQALRIVPENTQAVLTALIGGGIAWTQSRRYQDLSASYGLTAQETRKLEESYYKLEGSFQQDPGDATWAQFVDSAEEAFSREHNMWIATRDV